MLLPDIEIKKSYRSNVDHMINNFYNPILSTAQKYERAVGYFTLSSLLNAAKGLSNLIENGGIVRIIASPKLSKEDIKTIELGYKMKEDVILSAMIREFTNINSKVMEERLNYIATLIADDRLDIKIALMNHYGAYHEKFGIVEDLKNNKIMFTGSMNETESGQCNNFESFVVFKSWNGNQIDYISDYEQNFTNLWNNTTNGVTVEPFPNALKNKILEYKKTSYKKENEIDTIYDIQEKFPKIPDWFEARKYQKEAIESWKSNNYRGLLSMATGTGKTLTGLYGLTELFQEKQKLVSVIVCPQQHLVEQWAQDVKKFNIDPILCYSEYSNWKTRVFRAIRQINSDSINNFTIIATNKTFVSEDMQNFLKEIKCDIFLLVDEAHNAGTATMKKCLNDTYQYRLGLSATPKRYREEENTKFIYDFFHGEVYSYDLQRAITEGYLTKYLYFPHIVRLTETEQNEYNDLSKKIAKNIKEENGKIIINEFAKNLLIKRSKIVASAQNKLVLLNQLIKEYKNKSFILIYCGATKINDENAEDQIKQIRKVCKIVGIENLMKIRKFTADESAQEREEIIKMFSNGKDLQAIAAIKCLDEGVNIPAIQHAFILASSTDPKEFIQRRGRVLRLYDGKEFAYIHDFVTLPYDDHDENKKSSLVLTELKRIYEFNSLAENQEEGNAIINDIVTKYNINKNNILDVRDVYKIGGEVDE